MSFLQPCTAVELLLASRGFESSSSASSLQRSSAFLRHPHSHPARSLSASSDSPFCRPTVLTETWSDRYKSTINDGKIRRLKKKHERQGKTEGPSCTSRLLALEDFQHEDEVDAKDLPQKLADAVKGFHDHARYFMVRRSRSGSQLEG